MPVPRNEFIITTTHFPFAKDNIGPITGIGKVIPHLFGRCYVPCYLIDDTSAYIFIACVGCASVASGATFAEYFEGRFSPITGGPNITYAPWSVYYNNRCGIPTTEIIVGSNVPLSVTPNLSDALPHYMD